MSSVISISNLNFSFDGAPILEGVHVEIKKGEFIGIVGPNGGGKTTLLKLLMGFLTPKKGTILLHGESPIRSRTKIGYVPQVLRTDRDFPITVQELVLLGSLSHERTYSTENRKKAKWLIDEFGLGLYAKEPFSTLSGGLAQRALLARALLSDPDFLFLDEPMANVDSSSSLFILDYLEKLKGAKTILLITHDLRTVIERVDRILCVERKVSVLRPQEVCEHFALGLYHTPLLGQPANHFHEGINVHSCALSR